MLVTKGRNGRPIQPSGPSSNAPKQNRFYALQTQQDREGSPNMLTGIMKLFHFYVYSLLDPDIILSFVTSYKLWDLMLIWKTFIIHFHVATLVSDAIVAKRVYKKNSISVSHGDLVKLDILDFDVILEIIDFMHVMLPNIIESDWSLSRFLTNLSCHWKGQKYVFNGQFILHLKARKTISKG